MFTDEVPWGNMRDGNVIMEVCFFDKRPPRPSEPAMERGLHDEMWKLMEDCWKKYPVDRPEMTTVVHRLMPNYDWKEEMKERVNLYDPFAVSIRHHKSFAQNRSREKSGA